MRRNLGECSLRRSRRARDPMRSYDALPRPLRMWLSQAVLPWSPQSVQRIWDKSLRSGKSEDDILRALTELERRNLAKDHRASQTVLDAA